MIGSMRQRIKIKVPMSSQNADGGGSTFYELGGEYWCKVENINSSRALEDSQVQLNDSKRFTFRYMEPPVIDKSILIEYLGRDYTVNSVKIYQDRFRYYEVVGQTNGLPLEPIVTT